MREGADLRAATVVAVILMLWLSSATANARASVLIFHCSETTLCRVRPDGSHRRVITRNADGWTAGTLSASAEGNRVVFQGMGGFSLADGFARHRKHIQRFGGDAPQIDRSGDRLLWAMTTPHFDFCETWIATGRARCGEIPGLATWGAGHSLLRYWFNDDGWIVGICTTDFSGRCIRKVATAHRDGLFNPLPAVSPDGHMIAVKESVMGGIDRIVLFDMRNGRRIRNLTHGTQVDFPAWSPDGRYVTFTRYGHEMPEEGPFQDHFPADLWKVRVTGGRPRLIAKQGSDAVWVAH